MTTPPTSPGIGDTGVLGGRYELLEPIGHGGMSTIYRAVDRALGRPVAVKVIRHDPAAPEELTHLRERFRREAAHAARIPSHPNVVQVYDYGTEAEGDRDYIVMELLRGRDLRAALRERRFPPDEAVRVLVEAARGLAAGHRVGIVHRDVKPANLLLTEDGPDASVRVLDFGIAKALEADPEDDLTRFGRPPHTPAYASPEQLAGRELSPRADVFQLGLVAYELFTGERPFDAAHRERLARGEVVSPPHREDWTRLPAPLRAVVERALRPDPAERYPDAAAFGDALVEAWEGGDTVAVPSEPDDSTVFLPPNRPVEGAGPSPRGEHRRPSHGRRRGAIAAVAGLIALLALWSVLRGPGEAATPDPVPDGPEGAAALEEDFAPLYRDAVERLAEEP